MNCYICGSEQELSRKGKYSYLCRTCRRIEHHQRKDIKALGFEVYEPPRDWMKAYQESYDRIITKWTPKPSFSRK